MERTHVLCRGCNTDKPEGAFSIRRDRPCGRMSRCKECKARQKKEKRAALNEGQPQRKRTENPSHGVRYSRRYPHKRAAHKAVEWALAQGRLARGHCQKCGAKKAHAHHDDYSKPLEVTWLCDRHHKERHRELLAQAA